ncbi:hypothetical protein SDC9_164127 [bioreactor metagenome]|uniref:MarR family transcriptional regulator n=2 Tax=root TaxID=1 RepID=A0A645FQU3_9ZZZZ
MFNLNDCIGVITNKHNKEIIEAFNNRVISHGITRVQWIAIYYIGQNEGITQKQLSYILD